MTQSCVAGGPKMLEQGPDGSYYLVGSQCDSCGKVAFLEREVCPVCASFAGHTKVLIGRRAKINNFTVAHVAPAGYQAPYILGFVDLAEGPRIFATIEGDIAAAGRLKAGDDVQLAVEADGQRWKYVPVRGKEVNGNA